MGIERRVKKGYPGAEKLSPQYFEALKDCYDLHKAPATYPGHYVFAYADSIRALCLKHKCRTLLDYGCGKGKQYRKIWKTIGLPLDKYWGVRVVMYDPAYPRFAVEPRGRFDIVVCSQVLGSVPIVDLPVIVDRVYGFALKAVYIGEVIGVMKKRVFRNPELMPIGWSEEQWLAALDRPRNGIEVQVGFRYGDSVVVRAL
jgi:hypothetical protein